MATWRVFNTQRNAAIYELACWLRTLRRHAAEGDGTILNIITRIHERIVDEWPDDTDSLRDWLTSLTNEELITLRARLDQLPWLGRNRGRIVEDKGPTLAWAIPRQTATAEWAVQCPPFDLGGGAEPEWPPPEPAGG